MDLHNSFAKEIKQLITLNHLSIATCSILNANEIKKLKEERKYIELAKFNEKKFDNALKSQFEAIIIK